MNVITTVRLSLAAAFGAAILAAHAPVHAKGALDKALIEDIDSVFNDARLDVKAPGLIYSIIVDGKVAHTKSIGVRETETDSAIKKDTVFRIASMTKLMTALLILDLHDQGKLSLDRPAETYVPELKFLKYPTSDSRRVTTRDMLNHTAGFIWDDPWADRQMARTNEEFNAFLQRAEPFSHAPGSTYEYSNLGYAILGRIIENVSGQSFTERLQTRIFAPLGMKNSGLEVADIADEKRAYGYNWINNTFTDEPILASGSFDPIGGVWTTADDYAKFVTWVLSAWPARDDADNGPIPRRVVRSVTDGSYILDPGRRPGLQSTDDCVMSSGYGMGLHISRHCKAGAVLRHGGGFPGFGSYVIMLPERGVGVFAFANRTYAQMYVPVWDTIAKLVEAGVGEELGILPPDPRLLSAYEGIGKAYGAARITGGGVQFSDNFFLDRSEERWNTQLPAIRETVGDCNVSEPIKHDGRLSGSFTWNCEKGRVAGYMTLSPVNPNLIQMLRLRPIMRNSSGRDMTVDFNWH
ncbi:MAG: serine hydrolase domain-containing protein [Pseudomonadota bacterium]